MKLSKYFVLLVVVVLVLQQPATSKEFGLLVHQAVLHSSTLFSLFP